MPRLHSPFWSLPGLAACLCLGCSPEKKTAAPATPATPATPTAAAAAAAAGHTAEEIEDWSEAVKKQWGHLAAALAVAPAPDQPSPLEWTQLIELTQPAETQTKTVYSDPPLIVHQAGPAADATPAATTIQVTAQDLALQLRTRFFLPHPDSHPAAHFKLIGLEPHGAFLKTRQRLKTKGLRDGKEVHSLAVVDATWSKPAASSPPVLTSFSITSLVQSEKNPAAPAGFEDLASRLLGHNPAWPEQLQLGMNAWATRIDRSLKPDFLGYHGIAIADVNGDDREDIYLCQPGGLPNLLFLQQPDGTLSDVSNRAGVDWLDNSTGALLVDLDNDGDQDLAVATQRAFLVMENDGTGSFTLRSQLSGLGQGYSPTAADFDLDGDLDLLVLRYNAEGREVGDFPTPHPFYDARNGGANVLLENRGRFQFADVTETKGLGHENFRFSFAASWEDYDNDGDSDVYIANDFGPNHLFRNDRGTFTEVAAPSGAQDWGFGMSATWADYNRDGFMDLYVSNMFSGAGNQIIPHDTFNPSMAGTTRAQYLKMVRGNSLMLNSPKGILADVTNPMAEGFGSWAWGAKFADLNNDGWEDLYVANGYISQPDKDDL